MSSRSTQETRRFDRRDASDRWTQYKTVPDQANLRERIRLQAAEEAEAIDPSATPSRDDLVQTAHEILERLGLPLEHLGFTMVLAANAIWAKRLAAVPYTQRLLLLPRCLHNVSAEPKPPGDRNESVDDIFAICRRAEQLGYRTLIADGTPIVVKTLATEPIEAVVGVACLDSLDAVFDKIWSLGVPAVAVPLLRSDCNDTVADLHWLAEYVESLDTAAPRPTGTHLPVLQLATRIFSPEQLGDLLAPVEPNAHGPALDATSKIARDWLAQGGKRLRPFVALAATCALRGGGPDTLDDAALRVAVAIEAFHKASLAHDDIEDDDDQRYGHPTLHKAHGQAMAINVGDYLLGLGYRLLTTAGAETPGPVGAAVTAQMSRAHVHLAQGQGTELLWRRDHVWAPPTDEVLKVYALKTAPAFAAALTSGVLMGSGGEADPSLEVFARHIGVAFQVLNDLSGWTDDAAAERPTYLTALAAASAGESGAEELTVLASRAGESDEALEALTQRFEQLGVFTEANALVARLRGRAAELAEQMKPAALSDLCAFLIELILN